jgi:hypothetical protein
MPTKRIDLTGHKFGALTVLRHAGFDSGRRSLWNVCCSCGREKIVRSDSLTTGATRTCGGCKEQHPKARLTVSTISRDGESTHFAK